MHQYQICMFQNMQKNISHREHREKPIFNKNIKDK